MSNLKILLGDQSPFAGGLVRYLVVLKEFAGAEIIYNIHDTDAPWVANGQSLSICKGWKTNYWSTASRVAWSWDIPPAERTHWTPADANLLNSLMTSMNMPNGLLYLAGPQTNLTLSGIHQNVSGALFTDLSATMLKNELAWLNSLRQKLGLSEKSYIATQPEHWIQTMTGTETPISTTSETFRKEPVSLIGRIPALYYWKMSRDGTRETWDGKSIDSSDLLVPKAHALPLEDAYHGHTLACTGMPYLSEVMKLRDLYCPKVKIKILWIRFDWQPPVDPAIIIAQEYIAERKLKRNKDIVIPEYMIESVRKYWSQRPTALGYQLLGGELNPSFELRVY